LLMAGQKS